MELNIGSNIIKNTNGVLRVCGKEQIFLEIGDVDGQLLLTMDIYDVNCKHIAKLSRNSWVFNDNNKYEITTNPKSLKLINKESQDVLIEVNVVDRTKLNILNGKFYTHKGQLVTITSNYWNIMGLTMSKNCLDNCGGAVAIG